MFMTKSLLLKNICSSILNMVMVFMHVQHFELS
jgi:hypothetical protein